MSERTWHQYEGRFDRANVRLFNPMSVPGVGKTLLLEGALRGLVKDGVRALSSPIAVETLELLAGQPVRLR